MLLFKDLNASDLFSSQVDICNNQLMNQAIDEIGAENIIQFFKCSKISFPNSHLLVEDPSGPRSTCPGCHGFIRPGDKFCGDCGAPLQETLCPRCGTTVRPGKKFCTDCGKRLVEE